MAVVRPVPNSNRGSDHLHESLRASLLDIGLFAGRVVGRPMRDYQLEPARAIAGAVVGGEGGSFSVMMSRQAGKNELSAHIECYLLALFQEQRRKPGEGGADTEAAGGQQHPAIVHNAWESLAKGPMEAGARLHDPGWDWPGRYSFRPGRSRRS